MFKEDEYLAKFIRDAGEDAGEDAALDAEQPDATQAYFEDSNGETANGEPIFFSPYSP